METIIGRAGDVLGMLDPGYALLALIRPALELFRLETVAPNLSGLMVVTAVFLMVMYRYRQIMPACNALDQRIAFLKDCDSPGAFYGRIDQFDALMMREKFLAHGWSEFIETCLFIRRNDCVNVEISIRPSVFINLDEAEHSGLNIRWFRSLSGIFVGLGLLLTFIGLVAALYFSSSAINIVIDTARGLAPAEQTKAIQKALAQLLTTATFKFLTSIAGLGCSIVLGHYERRWTARLEQKFDALCRELERAPIIITPEQLANRQHSELCAQTELMRAFPSQVAAELSAQLQPLLVAGIEPVTAKLDDVITAITTSRQAPLQAMVQEFGATISGAAGREIKAVAETMAVLPGQISAATETLAVLPGQIAAAAGDLRTTIAALTQGLESLHARVVPEPQPVEEHPMAAIAAELGQAIGALHNLLAEAASRPDRSREANAALIVELSRAVARMEATGQANAAAIAALGDRLQTVTAETSRALADDTGRSIAAMAGATERLADTLGEALRQLEERSSRSANEIAERFLDAAKAAQEVSFQQASRVDDAITKIIAAGLQAGQGVGQAAADANRDLEQRAGVAASQVIDGSAQVLAQFRTTVDQLWRQVDGLSRALAAVEGKIAAHVGVLEGVTRATRENETALTGSARAVASASQPLAKVGDVLVKALDSVALTVESTVDTLKESQHQGQNLATDLRATLHQLQLVWSQHESRFATVDDSLARVLTSIIEHVDAHGVALRDHVVKIDTHLAQTVNNLAGNVEALQETAAELTRAITGMRKLVEALPPPSQERD